MKISDKTENIRNSFKLSEFSPTKFDKSCLIYNKSTYGIFLVTGKDGENYTIKVSMGNGLRLSDEILIAFYIKDELGDMPNLLVPENVYLGKNPINYPLFTSPSNRLNLSQCKPVTLTNIFLTRDFEYNYYVTKACLYNLGYYLGTHKGLLSYKAFVAFSFQVLTALQSLHKIGIWHRDVKTQNILVCDSDIAKRGYSGITYVIDGMSWTIKYKDTDGRDFKVIDYGESIIMNEFENPCLKFSYEVTVAVVNIFNAMWAKVFDKGLYFEELISSLRDCKTSIVDVITGAPIYKKLKYDDPQTFRVNIL